MSDLRHMGHPHNSSRRRHLHRRRRFNSLFWGLIWISLLPFPLLADDRLSLSQPLTVRWRFETNRTLNLTPAIDADVVYLPLGVGAIVSLKASDGLLLWKAETGGEFSAAPVADERGVYTASETGAPSNSVGPYARAGGALRALGRTSGVTRWMRTLQSPLRGSLALSQTTLFGGASDGRVYAIRKDNGEVLWSMQHSAPFASHPVADGGRVYIGSEDGTLFALDQKTGRTLWRYRTRGAVRGPVAVAGGVVYFGSADSYVYALSADGGRLRWRARTGARVQGVAHTPRGLAVASLDNFVYFLSLQRGDRLWKRQLAGRIAAQPLAASDGVLFAPLAGDACVVLDLHDGKQLNSLPVGQDNNTAASPVHIGQMLLLTTRRGLVAFARPDGNGHTLRTLSNDGHPKSGP